MVLYYLPLHLTQAYLPNPDSSCFNLIILYFDYKALYTMHPPGWKVELLILFKLKATKEQYPSSHYSNDLSSYLSLLLTFIHCKLISCSIMKSAVESNRKSCNITFVAFYPSSFNLFTFNNKHVNFSSLLL